MPINKDRDEIIAQKDAYFVNPIRQWHARQKQRVESRLQHREPLGIGLYLFQNFVIDRTEYFTLANLLSVSRGVLAYPYFLLFVDQHYLAAFTVLLVAYTTDFFDGIIAKGFNQETEVGKMADPFFDKVLHGTAILGLYWVGIIPGWLASAMVVLDGCLVLMAFVLKPLASALGLKRESGANPFGKWKFSCQCICLSGYLLSAPLAPASWPNTALTLVGLTFGTFALLLAVGSITEHALPGSLVSPQHLLLCIKKLLN